MKQIKKVFFTIFLFLFCLSFACAKNTDYSYLNIGNLKEETKVSANHILLYNLNDEKVVYQYRNEEQISIASLTKIMSAIVAIEHINNLDTFVEVPKEAFYQVNGYAEAGFKVGDKVTYRDLLYGTLLPSGADAVQALAILLSGSFDNFVNLMNEKAKDLEMNSTHYSNPVGRDDEKNYSTLDDLTNLLLYALKNETFYEIYTTRTYKTTNNLELVSTLVIPSINYALDIGLIKGSKSGFTRGAGLCLSSIAEFEGIKYLLILTDSLYVNGFPNHIFDSLTFYNYIEKHYHNYNILTKGQEIVNLQVLDGYIDEYKATSEENVSFYLDKEIENKIEYRYNGINTLTPKIKQNDKLGDIEVLYNQEVLYTYPVYLKEKISYRYTIYYCIGIIVLIFILFIFWIKRKRK